MPSITAHTRPRLWATAWLTAVAVLVGSAVAVLRLEPAPGHEYTKYRPLADYEVGVDLTRQPVPGWSTSATALGLGTPYLYAFGASADITVFGTANRIIALDTKSGREKWRRTSRFDNCEVRGDVVCRIGDGGSQPPQYVWLSARTGATIAPPPAAPPAFRIERRPMTDAYEHRYQQGFNLAVIRNADQRVLTTTVGYGEPIAAAYSDGYAVQPQPDPARASAGVDTYDASGRPVSHLPGWSLTTRYGATNAAAGCPTAIVYRPGSIGILDPDTSQLSWTAPLAFTTNETLVSSCVGRFLTVQTAGGEKPAHTQSFDLTTRQPLPPRSDGGGMIVAFHDNMIVVENSERRLVSPAEMLLQFDYRAVDLLTGQSRWSMPAWYRRFAGESAPGLARVGDQLFRKNNDASYTHLSNSGGGGRRPTR